MPSDLVDYLDASQDVLKQTVEWEKILFEEWEMSPIQEEYFVNMCKRNPAFADAITNDVSKRLTDHIDKRVSKCNGDPAKNSNVNIIFAGEQDSGKSTYMVALYLYYAKKHADYWKRKVDYTWTFSIPETLDKYIKADFFTMIMQDEEDEIEGTGKRLSLNRLGNMIKRGRCSGISLFKASPCLTEIKGCDYCLIPFGFLKKGKQLYLEKNDISECWSRAILYAKSRLKTGGWDPLGCVFFFVGDAIKFMQTNEYISRKKDSFEDLRIRGGGTSAISKEQLANREIYAKEVLKIAKKKGWDGKSKKALVGYLDFIENASFGSEEKDKIAQLAWDMKAKKETRKQKRQSKQTNEKSSEESNESSTEFTWDEKEILNQIASESKSEKISRNIEIYRNLVLGTKNQEDYVRELGLSATQIGKIRGEIQGKINNMLGHKYEPYCAEELKKKLEPDAISGDGDTGKYDLRMQKGDQITYVSVKCLDFARGSYSLSYEESRPEIEEAKKDAKSGKKANALIYVLNRFNKQRYITYINSDVIENQMLLATYKKRNFIIHLDHPGWYDKSPKLPKKGGEN